MSLEGGTITYRIGGEDQVCKTGTNSLKFGALMSCDIILDDAKAKNVHCEIKADAFGRITIRNFCNKNPISVNGQTISTKRPLLNGSKIEILNTEFTWNYANANTSGTSHSHQAEDIDEMKTPKRQMLAEPEQAPYSEPNFRKTASDFLSRRVSNHSFMKWNKPDTAASGDEVSDNEGMPKVNNPITPKSVYSTPKSVLSDVNDDDSRESTEIPTREPSLNLIELVTPAYKKTDSPMFKSALKSSSKSGQTPNILPKTKLTFVEEIDSPDSTSMSSSLGTITPETETALGTSSNDSDLIYLSSDDNSSNSSSVIELSEDDSNSPVTSTNVQETPKKIPRKAGATPRRTPQSLMKRAILTSAKKLNMSMNKDVSLNISSPNSRRQSTGVIPSRKKIAIAFNTTVRLEDTPQSPNRNRKSIGTPLSSTRRQSTTILRGSITKAKSPKSRLSLSAVKLGVQELSSTSNTPLATARKSIGTPLIDRRSIIADAKTPQSRLSMLGVQELSSSSTPLMSVRSSGSVKAATMGKPVISKSRPSIASLRKSMSLLGRSTPASATNTNSARRSLMTPVRSESVPRDVNTPRRSVMTPFRSASVSKDMGSPTATNTSTHLKSESESEDVEDDNMGNKTSPSKKPEHVPNDVGLGEDSIANETFTIDSDEEIDDNGDISIKSERPVIDENSSIIASPIVSGKLIAESDFKKLVKTPRKANDAPIPKTPIMKGVREMMQTPKNEPRTPIMRGVKEMLTTPKNDGGTPIMKGVKEMLNTPKDVKRTPVMKGIKEMLNTPKPIIKTPIMRGVREMMNTPRPIQNSPTMVGIKELMKGPKLATSTPILRGMKELLKSPPPQQDDSVNLQLDDLMKTPASKSAVKSQSTSTPVLKGVRELMKTPYANSPKLRGVREMLRTPKLSTVVEADDQDGIFKTPSAKNRMVLGSPKSAHISKDANSVELVQHVEYDLSDHMDQIEEIFETSGSKLSEEWVNDENEQKNLNSNSEYICSEEVFDKLAGKPIIRKTYVAKNQSLKDVSLNDVFHDDNSLPPTDVQVWLNDVENATLDQSDKTTNDPLALSLALSSRKSEVLRKLSCTQNSDTYVTEVSLSDSFELNTVKDPLAFSTILKSKQDKNATSTTENEMYLTIGTSSFRNTTDDPLKLSVLKTCEKSKSNPGITEAIQASDISGIDLLDDSTESSVFSANLAVTDDSSDTIQETGGLEEVTSSNMDDGHNGSDLDGSADLFEDATLEVSSSKDIAKSPKSKIYGNTLEESPQRRNLSTRMAKTPDVKKTPRRESRMTMGNPAQDNASFDVKTAKEDREMELAFENFADQPQVGSSARLAKTPDGKKTPKRNNRMTMGNPPLDSSFNVKSAKEKREIELAFENFNEQPAIRTNARLAQTPDEKKPTYRDTRKTMGHQPFNTSFDVEAAKAEREMEQAFENFVEEPEKVLTSRLAKTPDVKKMAKRNTRMTMGNQPLDAFFDVKSAKEKREMELAFEHFDEQSDVGERLAKTPDEKKTVKSDTRKTMGHQPLKASFDVEAAKAEREMELAFENFEEQPEVGSSARLAKTPDEKKPVKRDTRKTMGHQPMKASFDVEAAKAEREMELAFENFEEQPEVGSSARLAKTPDEKKPVKRDTRKTMGHQPLKASFDVEAAKSEREMELAFENFEEQPEVGSSARLAKTPDEKKPVKRDTRKTMGHQPLKASFDVEAAKAEREMELAFENFEEQPEVGSSARLAKTPDEKKPVKRDTRKTMGHQPMKASFDVEAAKAEREMELAFENFEEQPEVGSSARLAKTPDEKKPVKRDTRKTMGHQPLKASFDVEAAKSEREMELAFENFEEQPEVGSSARLAKTPDEKKPVKRDTRKTMGHQPLKASFDVEAAKAEREMELAFENFEEQPEVGSSARIAKTPDEKKPVKRDTRKTMGHQPLKASFDVEAAKAEREMELAFENFEEQPEIGSSARLAKTPEEKKPAKRDTRKTMGHQPLKASFDVEAAKAEREMELAFENFEEQPEVGSSARLAKTPDEKKPVKHDTRKTMGHQPLKASFDVEAAKAEREMELAFENFEEQPEVGSSARLAKTPDEKKPVKRDTRKTMGHQPLKASFDVEAAKAEREMELAFENFEEQPEVGSSARLAKTPDEKKPVKHDTRKTMGHQPLKASFDVEAAKAEREMELAFENFEEQPEVGSSARLAKTPDEKKPVKRDTRKTMGHQPLKASFDVEAAKAEREMELAFENFEEQPEIGSSARLAKTPEEKKPAKRDTRKTMGHQPLKATFDVKAAKENREKELAFEHFEEQPTISGTERLAQTPEMKRKSELNIRRTMGHKPSDSSFDAEAAKAERENEIALEKEKLKETDMSGGSDNVEDSSQSQEIIIPTRSRRDVKSNVKSCSVTTADAEDDVTSVKAIIVLEDDSSINNSSIASEDTEPQQQSKTIEIELVSKSRKTTRRRGEKCDELERETVEIAPETISDEKIEDVEQQKNSSNVKGEEDNKKPNRVTRKAVQKESSDVEQMGNHENLRETGRRATTLKSDENVQHEDGVQIASNEETSEEHSKPEKAVVAPRATRRGLKFKASPSEVDNIVSQEEVKSEEHSNSKPEKVQTEEPSRRIEPRKTRRVLKSKNVKTKSNDSAEVETPLENDPECPIEGQMTAEIKIEIDLDEVPPTSIPERPKRAGKRAVAAPVTRRGRYKKVDEESEGTTEEADKDTVDLGTKKSTTRHNKENLQKEQEDESEAEPRTPIKPRLLGETAEVEFKTPQSVAVISRTRLLQSTSKLTPVVKQEVEAEDVEPSTPTTRSRRTKTVEESTPTTTPSVRTRRAASVVQTPVLSAVQTPVRNMRKGTAVKVEIEESTAPSGRTRRAASVMQTPTQKASVGRPRKANTDIVSESITTETARGVNVNTEAEAEETTNASVVQTPKASVGRPRRANTNIVSELNVKTEAEEANNPEEQLTTPNVRDTKKRAVKVADESTSSTRGRRRGATVDHIVESSEDTDATEIKKVAVSSKARGGKRGKAVAVVESSEDVELSGTEHISVRTRKRIGKGEDNPSSVAKKDKLVEVVDAADSTDLTDAIKDDEKEAEPIIASRQTITTATAEGGVNMKTEPEKTTKNPEEQLTTLHVRDSKKRAVKVADESTSSTRGRRRGAVVDHSVESSEDTDATEIKKVAVSSKARGGKKGKTVAVVESSEDVELSGTENISENQPKVRTRKRIAMGEDNPSSVAKKDKPVEVVVAADSSDLTDAIKDDEKEAEPIVDPKQTTRTRGRKQLEVTKPEVPNKRTKLKTEPEVVRTDDSTSEQHSEDTTTDNMPNEEKPTKRSRKVAPPKATAEAVEKVVVAETKPSTRGKRKVGLVDIAQAEPEKDQTEPEVVPTEDSTSDQHSEDTTTNNIPKEEKPTKRSRKVAPPKATAEAVEEVVVAETKPSTRGKRKVALVDTAQAEPEEVVPQKRATRTRRN